jgi:hypothetical protein
LIASCAATVALDPATVRTATLNSLQSGAVVMTTGVGSAQTVDVTISAVDTTASILFFNFRGDSDEPGDGQVRGHRTSSTNMQFFRANDSSLTNLTIQRQLMEFSVAEWEKTIRTI